MLTQIRSYFPNSGYLTFPYIQSVSGGNSEKTLRLKFLGFDVLCCRVGEFWSIFYHWYVCSPLLIHPRLHFMSLLPTIGNSLTSRMRGRYR